MCLILPALVVRVEGEEVEVELQEGMRATASNVLHPEVAVGQYVLVDRGLVLEIIEPVEAEAILAMYAEMGELLGQADAAHWTDEPEASAASVTAASAEGERG